MLNVFGLAKGNSKIPIPCQILSRLYCSLIYCMKSHILTLLLKNYNIFLNNDFSFCSRYVSPNQVRKLAI